MMTTTEPGSMAKDRTTVPGGPELSGTTFASRSARVAQMARRVWLSVGFPLGEIDFRSVRVAAPDVRLGLPHRWPYR